MSNETAALMRRPLKRFRSGARGAGIMCQIMGGGGGPLDPAARVLRHRAGGYSPPNGSHDLVKDNPQTDDDPKSLQY